MNSGRAVLRGRWQLPCPIIVVDSTPAVQKGLVMSILKTLLTICDVKGGGFSFLPSLFRKRAPRVFLVVLISGLLCGCEGNANRADVNENEDILDDTPVDPRPDGDPLPDGDPMIDGDPRPDGDPVIDGDPRSDGDPRPDGDPLPDSEVEDFCTSTSQCEYGACIDGSCLPCENNFQCATESNPALSPEACCGCGTSCWAGECVDVCVDAACCFDVMSCGPDCESICFEDYQCDFGYSCVEGSCVDEPPPSCGPYLGALADCPFQYMEPINEGCTEVRCMEAACTNDGDCPSMSSRRSGISCVLGNCVYCSLNEHCNSGEVCRAGRCVTETTGCPPPPACSEPGCRLLSISEVPCPVCICDSFFNFPCSTDGECEHLSIYPFSRCVYGRCTECGNDDDCDYGKCVQPGLCYDFNLPLNSLYGTWVIGWYGGMDHFSYFRFEPDGTLRRGAYEEEGTFSDDIPSFPCYSENMVTPQVGTWEGEVTNSGLFIIRMSLNLSCDDGDGWSDRFLVSVESLEEDGDLLRFSNLDGEWAWDGFKVDVEDCLPDFSVCQNPSFWD